MDTDINYDFLHNLVDETGEKSQTTLADSMGVSLSTVKRWISGDIETKYIIALCLKYDICIWRFIRVQSEEVGETNPIRYKYIRFRSDLMIEDAKAKNKNCSDAQLMKIFDIKHDTFVNMKDVDGKALDIKPEIYCCICEEAELIIFKYVEYETVDDKEDGKIYTREVINDTVCNKAQKVINKYTDHLDGEEIKQAFVKEVVDGVHEVTHMTDNMI